MNIRKMKISDYKESFALWNNTKGMGIRSLDDSENGIARFLKRNPNTCFVVEMDNHIVGVIMGGHDGRRGYIYHAVVEEAFRNNGIGNLLVDTVLKAFAKEGINKVALVAFRTNQIGNEFWNRMGFKERQDLVYRDKSINEHNL